MRSLTFLVVLYVAFLALFPAISEIYKAAEDNVQCCEKDCCKGNSSGEKQGSDSQEQGDCCPMGICNPFDLCACCIGFIPSGQIIPVLNIQAMKMLRISITPSTGSDYSSDCWNPPKIG
jgi:hypothetical protein